MDIISKTLQKNRERKVKIVLKKAKFKIPKIRKSKMTFHYYQHHQNKTNRL